VLSGLLTYLAERSWAGLLRDAVDILVVYYGCYRALLVLRGTRAMQVGIGLLVVMVLYGLARLFELATVLSIMGTLFSSLLLIIVVVFQSDIRRGLQRIGSQAIFSRFTRGPETKVIDEVVEAATELARHRIGALVAFEQDANLDEFVGAHKGHLVDAAVTRELLVSLFLPEAVNRLHDGAVIIRNLRIAKAGVFFPMPEQGVVDESFGSRHRAALGITEETDAVVVVVSEERGNISFCFNGNIASNLDGPKLRTMLEAVFSPKAAQKKAQAGRRSAIPVAAASVSSDAGDAQSRAEATETPAPRVHPAVDADTSGPLSTRAGVEARAAGLSMSERGVDGTDETRPIRGPESERPPPLRPRVSADDAVHSTGRGSMPGRGTPIAARPVLTPREVASVRSPLPVGTGEDRPDQQGGRNDPGEGRS